MVLNALTSVWIVQKETGILGHLEGEVNEAAINKIAFLDQLSEKIPYK